MFGDKLAKVQKLTEKKKTEGLTELAHDKREDVRAAAIAGLGKCGDDMAYNTLIPLIHDPQAPIRVAAIKALGEMGRPSARTHIEHQMNMEKDESVLAAMHEALGHMHDKEQ